MTFQGTWSWGALEVPTRSASLVAIQAAIQDTLDALSRGSYSAAAPRAL